MSETKRRPKGTGSLRHLGGERWQLTAKVHGKRMSKVFTARNATEANRAAGTVLAELQAERARTADDRGAERELRRRWTVKRYVAYYLTKSAHRLAPTTRERYRQILENQVVPRIGSLPFREVTAADLSRMYARLAEKGAGRYGGKLSGQTIWTVHAVVRALYSFAMEEGDVDKSPAASRSARPNVSRDGRSRDALDVAAVEQFVELAREEARDVFVAVLLSARLGLRRGEALALQWRDMDFEKREATIRRAVTETPDDGLTVKATKTGKQRVVPLDDLTVAELKTVQRKQRARRLEFGRGWQGAAKPAEDWIASTPTGAGISPDDYTNAFRALAKRHKVAVTPHGLRHAWCSQMIALGFDPVTIATMTGHSPDVLMRTYAHAFDKRKREAVDAMGAARLAARGEA